MDLEKTLTKLSPYIIEWVSICIKISVFIILSWPVSNWASNRFSEILKRFKLETTIRRTLKKLANLFLKFIILMIALNFTGMKMTVFASILGGLSIALGFALKGNISNVANGILLLINKPFKSGDFIETGGISGTVICIDFIYTELKTSNNQRVIVPNSQFLNKPLINFAAHNTRRIEIVVGLDYNDNLEEACQSFKAALQKIEVVLDDPPIDIWLTDFGESSINLSIRAWCNRDQFLQIRHNIILTIQKVCKAEAYTIPFPQHDIHIIENPACGAKQSVVSLQESQNNA